MSCPCFLLGKHEFLALNLNATFLSFVVKSTSSMLLFLATISSERQEDKIYMPSKPYAICANRCLLFKTIKAKHKF